MAEWLLACLLEDVPTLVGIDHGFSFPLRYFEVHHLAPDWPSFLEDFQRHWPTDEEHCYVDFVRDGLSGNGADRTGSSRWRCLTEERSGSAKSVCHFDVPGSVAKSTHAGVPWLLYLRRHLSERVHFWPFDGWQLNCAFGDAAEVRDRYCHVHHPCNASHETFSLAQGQLEHLTDQHGCLDRMIGIFLRSAPCACLVGPPLVNRILCKPDVDVPTPA